MRTLITGNETILSMMYLISNGVDASEINSPEFKKRFKEEGEKAKTLAKNSNEEIKPSVFNHVVMANKNIFAYNTLYNALAWLSNAEYNELTGKSKLTPERREEFLNMGFCVPKNIDERKNYALWRESMGKNRNYLSLNITTTLKCNAKCPYCYEAGVDPVDFDKSKIEDLIKFIKRENPTNSVKLNWFGGEPLLNTALIDEVTKKVSESGFKYSCYIITNGSMINKRMIAKFKRWKVRGVQITLDGTAKNYEAKKSYPKNFKEPFNKILERIEWLSSKNIKVDVRLNTDRENLNDMIDLIYLLQARFDGDKNVVYYPAFVTGLNDVLTDREKIDFIKRIFTGVVNPEKISVNNRLYSFPRSLPCMKNDPRSFSVDVYGKIYDCEHLVGRPKESIGTLKRLPKAKNQAREKFELRKECENCAFLPKCMGGCASNYKTDGVGCMIERYIIPAYMEYMCETTDPIFDDDFVERIINETTQTANAEDLRSIKGEISEIAKVQTEILETLKNTEKLLKLQIASRLLDDAEQVLSKGKGGKKK